MRPEHPSADSTAEQLPEEDQDRLARILDDYLIAMELGTPIGPEELLARHPEDAEHLRGYLSGLQVFHAAAVAPESQQPFPAAGGKWPTAQTVGDFRLLREIGRGGMGVVYEALQISLQRRVALKILPFAATHDEKQIDRFKNEAQAAAHVQHPNIVPVYAFGEEGGVHYYAMQLIEGQSLTTLLDELHTGAGPSSVGTTAPNHLRTTWGNDVGNKPIVVRRQRAFSASATMEPSSTNDHVRAVARLGIQAAEALHAAHEHGIVHRDIKPSNLLLDDHGKLWVTDFGLARCREHAGLTQTGDILGTMRYMSPEQARGRGELVDHRTDIYSLGVTLYELATLHHPSGDASDVELLVDRDRFNHKLLRHWNRHIPVDFQTIIMKAIAEFPGERYASAKELTDDLGRFLEGKPILASPPSLASRAGKWAGRHRKLLYAAAAVLLVAFAGQSYNTLLLAKKNAEKERALTAARDNLHEAHVVLDRVTQLGDQLAAIPGAEGVRYQLLEDSLGHYQRFAEKAANEPALATDLALAYSKLGSLSEKMGKSEESLQEHLAARDMWKARVAEQPSNIEYSRNLASCYNNVGMQLAELGRRDEALASLQDSQRILRALLADNPESADLSAVLATTYSNLGLVLRQAGDQSAAAEKFREAIAIQERLSAQSPEDEAVLRGLAASYNNLGSLADAATGDRVVGMYQKAIDIQRQLVKSHPVNRIYQGELARTYNNLGFVLAHRQDWQNAELCYGDAVRIQQYLVKSSPLAGAYRRDLAISYNNLGMVQSRLRRFAEAESSFRQALDLQRLLLAAEPDGVNALSNLGGVYNNLGMLLDQQERFTDAEAAYQQAIRFQRKAFAAVPDGPTYRDLLSNHYANYAKCLQRQEKLQAADEVAHERDLLLAGH